MAVERVDYYSDQDYEAALLSEQQQSNEYGSCPNCGATVHITDLGDENGKTCCKYCYQVDHGTELSEFYKMIGYSGMIRDLIQYAETDQQRRQLDVMVSLFKNRFKKQPTLNQYVDDICTDIYKIQTIR